MLITAEDGGDRFTDDELLGNMHLILIAGHDTTLNTMARLVAEDFIWEGHKLKKGQIVHWLIAGANRDSKVFTDPEKLDLTRATDTVMTFGPGPHQCIGHLLAKMQLTEFFPAFLERYEAWEVLEDELPFGGGLAFRGPQSMHVKLKGR